VVQLQRGTRVAEVEPQLARNPARACHDDWSSADFVGYQVKMTPEAVARLLDQLVDEGFLERRVYQYGRSLGRSLTRAGRSRLRASAQRIGDGDFANCDVTHLKICRPTMTTCETQPGLYQYVAVTGV